MTRKRPRRNVRRSVVTKGQSLFDEGIDVSHHQGQIDWAQVAAAGVGWTFIKATQGEAFIDRRFQDNWRGAKDSGLGRGAYHFFAPGASVASQVDNFTRAVTLEPGDFPPVLDLETDGQDWNALPTHVRLPVVLELLEALEAHYRVKPIVYTNRRTIEEVFAGRPGRLTDFPLWVASYKKSPPPTMPRGWQTWTFWQYTDAGRVAGIQTQVDRNRRNSPVVTLTGAFVASKLTVASATIDPRPRPSPIDHLNGIWKHIEEAADAGRVAVPITQLDIHIVMEVSGRTTMDVTFRTGGSVAGANAPNRRVHSDRGRMRS